MPRQVMKDHPTAHDGDPEALQTALWDFEVQPKVQHYSVGCCRSSAKCCKDRGYDQDRTRYRMNRPWGRTLHRHRGGEGGGDAFRSSTGRGDFAVGVDDVPVPVPLLEQLQAEGRHRSESGGRCCSQGQSLGPERQSEMEQSARSYRH